MVGGDKKPGDVKIGGKKFRETGKAAINRNEARLAEGVGGIRQPASGALPHRKGDVVIDDTIFSTNRFLFDSKQTEGSTIIISGKDLTKICREASGESKEPGLLVTIAKVADTTPTEWTMVPLKTFTDMLERIRYYESHTDRDD